jgi:hypothetical protein
MSQDGHAEAVPIPGAGSSLSPADMRAMLALAMAGPVAEKQPVFWRSLQTPGYALFSELLETRLEPFTYGPLALVDAHVVTANSGEGVCACFTSVMTAYRTLDAVTHQLWRWIALHLGAGFRLLCKPRDLDAADVEVVLDDQGRP